MGGRGGLWGSGWFLFFSRLEVKFNFKFKFKFNGNGNGNGNVNVNGYEPGVRVP